MLSRSRIGLACCLVVACIAVFIIISFRKTKATWDFSKSNSINIVDWPQHSMTGDGIARRDDIDEITLILSENKKINTLIDEMYIDKKGTEISTVTLVYPKMTLADAATISKRILNDFDYETSTLEEWMKTISDTEATGPSFQHHYQTQSTSLSIDIRYSYNDSNPWRLRVEIYLKKK